MPWFKSKPAPELSDPFATATTPDQLIASRICVLMLEDIAQWEDQRKDWSREDLLPKLYQKAPLDRLVIGDTRGIHVIHSAEEIRVQLSYQLLQAEPWNSRRGSWDKRYYVGLRMNRVLVNDTHLDVEVGEDILKVYLAAREALAVSKQAVDNMVVNEIKWNLAEQLLKMKRTPEGALIPNVNPD